MGMITITINTDKAEADINSRSKAIFDFLKMDLRSFSESIQNFSWVFSENVFLNVISALSVFKNQNFTKDDYTSISEAIDIIANTTEYTFSSSFEHRMLLNAFIIMVSGEIDKSFLKLNEHEIDKFLTLEKTDVNIWASHILLNYYTEHMDHEEDYSTYLKFLVRWSNIREDYEALCNSIYKTDYDSLVEGLKKYAV